MRAQGRPAGRLAGTSAPLAPEGSPPAESALAQPGRGEGWVFPPYLKPAEEPPLGRRPEPHLVEKAQVKIGQNESVL